MSKSPSWSDALTVTGVSPAAPQRCVGDTEATVGSCGRSAARLGPPGAPPSVTARAANVGAHAARDLEPQPAATALRLAYAPRIASGPIVLELCWKRRQTDANADKNPSPGNPLTLVNVCSWLSSVVTYAPPVPAFNFQWAWSSGTVAGRAAGLV
jgi:hypothetical protein